MASDVTNASVKLSWSFDPPVTGGVVSYAAIFNGFGNGTLSFTGGNVMEQIIFNLEPFTVYNFNVTLLNTFGGRSGSKVTINTVTLPNGNLNFKYNHLFLSNMHSSYCSDSYQCCVY